METKKIKKSLGIIASELSKLQTNKQKHKRREISAEESNLMAWVYACCKGLTVHEAITKYEDEVLNYQPKLK